MIWQKYREPWQKMSESTGMPMLQHVDAELASRPQLRRQGGQGWVRVH